MLCDQSANLPRKLQTSARLDSHFIMNFSLSLKSMKHHFWWFIHILAGWTWLQVPSLALPFFCGRFAAPDLPAVPLASTLAMVALNDTLSLVRGSMGFPSSPVSRRWITRVSTCFLTIKCTQFFVLDLTIQWIQIRPVSLVICQREGEPGWRFQHVTPLKNMKFSWDHPCRTFKICLTPKTRSNIRRCLRSYGRWSGHVRSCLQLEDHLRFGGKPRSPHCFDDITVRVPNLQGLGMTCHSWPIAYPNTQVVPQG